MQTTHSSDGAMREGEPPYRSPEDSTPTVAKGSWLTRRRLILAAVSLPLLALVWWFGAYPRGMIVAMADCACGHYEFQTFGFPAPWAAETRQLAAERYGVKVRAVAGCVVTEELVWYVNGYNCVSRSRMQARFGKDVIAECFEDARAGWQPANLNE